MTFTIVLAVASGFVLIANAIEKIVRAIKVAKAPHAAHNERIESLERWREEVDRKLIRDNDRLLDNDVSNRVTQRAILALLAHSIDGNNTIQLERAREELQDHLINR